MGEPAAVYVVEETAQPLIEDGRYIGAVAAAVLGEFAQGKVAVQVGLLFLPEKINVDGQVIKTCDNSAWEFRCSE